MQKIRIYYISIEGNTKHFVTKMSTLFHNLNLHRIDMQTDLFKITSPYFVFVPSYATYEKHQQKCVELPQTFPMTEELAYQHNYKYCLGCIGSGNKNFSQDQYCWNAKLYHQKFGIPVTDTYELRGTMADENRIDRKLVSIWNHKTGEHLTSQSKHLVNPRLQKLEQKYHQDLLGRHLR